MSPADAFEDSDAAYVMGLLDADERQAFEKHLDTCDACALRVQELQQTTDLLGRVSEADVLAIDQLEAGPEPQLPDTLLPSLLRRAGMARRRRRLVTLGLSSLVAACLVALSVLVFSPSSSPHTGRPVAMAPLATTGLRATAVVSEKQWGTEISLDCSYPGSTAELTPQTFGLVVVGRDGARQSLGTWTVEGGRHTAFTSGTALTPEQLRALQITRLDGTPILGLNV
jgi:anti-sigma-K factor RskA